MANSMQAAAQIYREALRATVKKYSLLYVSEGALLAIAGLFAIVFPFTSSAAIAVPLGWLLIVTAVLQGIILIGMRSMPHFGFQLLSVVIAAVVGFLLLRDPQLAKETIVLLVITFLMLQGVSRLVFGLSIRPFPGWPWVTASGVLGILLSLVLLLNLPDPPTWLVGLLVGIEMIGEGTAIAFLAWSSTRKSKLSAKGERR
jgi:uncharacterized membrane protein HdeD (DUF308 family)